MLLIFDWDGTLSDSADKIISCVQKAAHGANVPVLAPDVIRNIIGLGLPEAFLKLYPDRDDHERERIAKHYVDIFLDEDQQPSPFFDGVLEGLNQLRDQGYRLSVATGKSRRGLDRVLRDTQLEGFFHGSRCADETLSKPHPQMLTELLDEFDTPAEQALMIGDTEYDMSMAEALDMPRAAVSYGAHKLERLRAYDPVFCFDHFSEFVSWINQRN